MQYSWFNYCSSTLQIQISRGICRLSLSIYLFKFEVQTCLHNVFALPNMFWKAGHLHWRLLRLVSCLISSPWLRLMCAIGALTPILWGHSILFLYSFPDNPQSTEIVFFLANISKLQGERNHCFSLGPSEIWGMYITPTWPVHFHRFTWQFCLMVQK